MSRAWGALAWVTTLALLAAFLWLDPAKLGTAAGQARAWKELHVVTGAPTVGAIVAGLRASIVAGAWVLASAGLGARLLRSSALRTGFASCFGAGFGIASAWLFLIGALGAFYAPLAALPLLGLAFLREVPRPPRVGPWLALFLVLPLVDVLAPPVDTDEIYQHLALARRILDTHGLVGGFDHPDGSRPMPVQLGYAALHVLGGEGAPRLWHLAVTATLLGTITTIARERYGRAGLGAIALVGSYSFLVEAGLAYNDLPAALFVLLAGEALLRDHDRAFGLYGGLALCAKYTAAPVLVGLGLVAMVQRRRIPWGAALALVPLLPWWLHNAVDGLHPMFPYAGWPDVGGFVFAYPEKYGMGRAPLDLLKLPWNVLMQARTDNFHFLGRINLAWALLVPVALWKERRHPYAAALVFAGIGWAAGPQLLRYLLPVAGIAAVLVASVRLRWPVLALLIGSLPHNLIPLLVHAPEKLAASLGVEPRDVYLEQNLSAAKALAYLRDEVPHDAPVAMLFSWQGYHVEQPWILGSVEDHVPSRWWLLEHGDHALTDLRDQGVRYLLVGDIFFLKKDYPTLSIADFDRQFDSPVDQLRALLERDATLRFSARRWEVWELRLDATPAPR